MTQNNTEEHVWRKTKTTDKKPHLPAGRQGKQWNDTEISLPGATTNFSNYTNHKTTSFNRDL
jgi:hypothetical protein